MKIYKEYRMGKEWLIIDGEWKHTTMDNPLLPLTLGKGICGNVCVEHFWIDGVPTKDTDFVITKTTIETNHRGV